MTSPPFEFRYRYLLHVLIYVLGFTAPWLYIPAVHQVLQGPQQSIWLALAGQVARQGWLSLSAAVVAFTVLALISAWAGALLRIWGTAYLGASIVIDSAMHGGAVVADGPYRHVRNPLYLGTFLMTLALVILMSASGAIFTIVLIGLLQLRLILGEERYLLARLGPAYTAYRERVPRILPSLVPRVPASGTTPLWLQAALSEIYPLGVAASFSVLAWRYNSLLLIRCVVVCFGASLLTRALTLQTRQASHAK